MPWRRLLSSGCSTEATIFSKACTARRAVSDQENWRACVSAWERWDSRNSSLPSASVILAVMDAISRGSNSAESNPMTSGKLEVLAAITGAPQAMASSAGRPKPSCQDGNTNNSHRLYSCTSSSSVTYPVKRSSSSRSPTLRASWLSPWRSPSDILPANSSWWLLRNGTLRFANAWIRRGRFLRSSAPPV
ncbi:hypothetical protein D3C77_446370 [compost metagenome]